MRTTCAIALAATMLDRRTSFFWELVCRRSPWEEGAEDGAVATTIMGGVTPCNATSTRVAVQGVEGGRCNDSID